MSAKEKVYQLMSDKGCGLFPLEEIEGDKRLFDLGFDSLRYMELVVLLEETFSMTFPDELLEIKPETTVDEIVQMIKPNHQ